MDDLLDFLKTPPRPNPNTERVDVEFDVRLGKKKCLKRLELAQTIAKVDELVLAVDSLKSQNFVLQQQLKDFHTTAQQVEELYTKEKNKNITIKKSFDKLQSEYAKIDMDLTNMRMVNEQMKARLAEYDGRPIKFNNLVVKYVNIMDKLEGDDILRYNYDKDLVVRLKEYCTVANLKIKATNSPKSSKSRGNKIKTREMFVQCDLFEDSSQKEDYSRPKNKTHTRDQNTQYVLAMRDQACQYISTMITRQTNTEKIIQKHVQTMFPEPPAIDDILKVFSRWGNIRSISPLLESPSRESCTPPKLLLKKFSTAGTCTMLCNIRRKIDYLPINNSSNIKQEILTPSVSPTPISFPITQIRSRMSSHLRNVSSNINPNSIQELFNSTTNSSLEQLSFNAFNDLWQIFGKMLLSLLQSDNTGIATTNTNTAFNQQQFLDWLRELYMSSQNQNTSTVQAQTLDQTDTNVLTSPLHFNEASVLTNVVRPQPQKMGYVTKNFIENPTNTSSSTNSTDNNSTNPIRISGTLNVPLECLQQNSDSMEVYETQISPNQAKLEAANQQNFVPNLHKIDKTNTSKKRVKPSKHQKILDEIQELLPETRLNEKKFKALKRLFKSNHRKKDFEARTNSKPNENNNDNKFETAVDFLNTFAVAQEGQQPFGKEFSETEKIFLKQISNANITNNATKAVKSPGITCTKTLSNTTSIKPLSNSSRKTLLGQRKQSISSSAIIENKYRTLFDDSSSELDEKEVETENSIFNIKPVIKVSGNSNFNAIDSTEDANEDCASQPIDGCTKSNSRNTPQQSWLSNTQTSNPIFINSCNHNFSLERTTLADIYQIENPKDSKSISQSNRSFTVIENSLESDLKHQSYDYTGKINSIYNSEAKLNKETVILKEVKDGSDANNFNEHGNRMSNIELKGSLDQTEKPAPEHSSEPMPIPDDNSLETCLITTPIYPTDFEKDFELSSSDEESLVIGNNFGVSQKCHSKSIELKSKNVQSNQEKNITLCDSNQSFIISDSNYLIPTKPDSLEIDIEPPHSKENSNLKPNENFKPEQRNDSKFNNNQQHVKICKSIFSFGNLGSPNAIRNNKPGQEKDVEVALNSCRLKFAAESKVENHKHSKVETQSEQNKLNSFNCNEGLKSFRSNQPEDKILIINNTKMLNKLHKPIQNLNEENFSDVNNSLLLKCAHKNYLGIKDVVSETSNSINNLIKLSETEEGNKNMSNTIKFTQSPSTNNDYINQSKTEDKSLVSPVITLSDAPLTGEPTLNSREVHELSEKYFGDETISPISGLTLQLKKNGFTKQRDKKNSGIESEITKSNISKSCREHEILPNSPICLESLNKSHKNHLDKQIDKCKQEIKRTFKNTEIFSTESMSPIIDINSYKSMDTVGEIDLNDSLSNENELMIDEDVEENNTKQFETDPLSRSTILSKSRENLDEIMNFSNISTLLNSNLYNNGDITKSIPIVNDTLMEDMGVVNTPTTLEIKPKSGRKRKSEYPAEVQPCKRSQRLKDKQMLLMESLNISKTPIELGKYTKGRKNLIKNNVPKFEITENSKLVENEVTLSLGFFKERDAEVEMTRNNKSFTLTKSLTSKVTDDEMSNKIESPHKQKCRNQLSLEHEQQRNCSKHEENTQSPLSNIKSDLPQEKSCNPNSFENCIYSDSPLSPAPIETHDEDTSDKLVTIATERLPQFMPQDDILTDFLIKTYKNENQKQVLESINTKEYKRKGHILNQFEYQLKSYCYDEMELDLYCTSARVINKLLSISPDFNLIQTALINIVQNDEGRNVGENDLPSVIQEMPPRHLSKCLQRLFAFLKNVVTRNDDFCKDLISKIESLLFNSKQVEKLSLQATLSLTQLFLMSCKIQEYLQIPKHPARIFIAKCLYFYLQKSVLMIHEVLMWYPTVLPHREDKTYDRSDALISVIQHILMNTKYDMDKTKTDLRDKLLLSKLRYEYHFEPYKPSQEEVINVLVEKLKTSKFYNISLAFAVLCKRIGASKTQHIVLGTQLLPLANEYYNMALKTDEYDKRIAVLLEVISMLVKPLPIETDTQIFFNEFSRFFNGFERQLIQEAALCSILRLQRFNVVHCYKLLHHFQPTYNLNTHTQAMVKTFFYRRSQMFWRDLSQNSIHFN